MIGLAGGQFANDIEEASSSLEKSFQSVIDLKNNPLQRGCPLLVRT
jgi:hypothetical protein